MSILLTDFNDDGDLDLLEGNDFKIPDQIYIGDGKGAFNRVLASENMFETTTHTTMSIKSEDFDNDQVSELFFSQIAGRSEGVTDHLTLKPIELYCFDLGDADDLTNCQINQSTNAWYKSGGRRLDISKTANCVGHGATYEAECKAMMIKDIAIQKNDPSVCGYIGEDQIRTKLMCEMHFRPAAKPSDELRVQGIPQKRGANALLRIQKDGTYAHQTDAAGLGIGGWSWDVKIEDFDLDGFVDVYITNGSWIVANISPSNMFFHNNGDGTFEEKTAEFGLEEFFILPSVTATDFENDGDLDLVGQALNGPVMAFTNNSQELNRIAFEMRDYVGNHFCFGCKITIHLADGSSQSREIQSGGGFESYDSSKAYFGIGNQSETTGIEIFWSTGESSILEGPFSAGRKYTITRNPNGG